MADLGKSISILTRGKLDRMTYPIQASTVVYGGASISVDSSGNAGVLTAGERFIGFCVAKQPNDNTTTTAALAGYDVEVFCKGQVRLAVTAAAAGDEGKAVFCSSDDNTYSYTPKAFQYVGKVVQFDSSGYVWVELDPGNTQWETFVSLATAAELALPDAVQGVCYAFEDVEGGSVLVAADGTCTLLGGSTNFDDADTDGALCVYDAGTGAYVKNRLAAASTVHIKWFGSK